jgi:zinc transport system substrate-binding protein
MAALFAVTLVAALATATSAEEQGAIRAFAGIPPIQYAVDRIGGAHVETSVLVPPGQSPHSFDATPRQMVALAESRVYFAVGLPFERELLARIEGLDPDLTVVDTGRGVPRRTFEERGHEEEHGDALEHPDTAPTDPHIWLSPRLFRVQARNVLLALSAIDPEHEDDYRENYEKLIIDLNALDAEIGQALAPVRGRAVYVFHPAFGYLTDAYGLTQVAVETGGSEPSARELAVLIRRAREDGVRVIFVQPQFATKSAEAVAREIGGAVVPIDPLAYDYLKNLRDMAGRIQSALWDGGDE